MRFADFASTAAERKLRAIDDLHVKAETAGDRYAYCTTCRHPWPCQTAEILRATA